MVYRIFYAEGVACRRPALSWTPYFCVCFQWYSLISLKAACEWHYKSFLPGTWCDASSVPALGTLRHISSTKRHCQSAIIFSFRGLFLSLPLLWNFHFIPFLSSQDFLSAYLNLWLHPLSLIVNLMRLALLGEVALKHFLLPSVFFSFCHISCSFPSHPAYIVLFPLFPVPHRSIYLLALRIKGKYLTVCFCPTRQDCHDSFPEWKLRFKAPRELKLATLYFPSTRKEIKNDVGREKYVIWWSNHTVIWCSCWHQHSAKLQCSRGTAAQPTSQGQQMAASGTDVESLSHLSKYGLAEYGGQIQTVFPHPILIK